MNNLRPFSPTKLAPSLPPQNTAPRALSTATKPAASSVLFKPATPMQATPMQALVQSFLNPQTAVTLADQEYFQSNTKTVKISKPEELRGSNPIQLLPARGFLILIAHTEAARQEIAEFQDLLQEKELATDSVQMTKVQDFENLRKTDPKTLTLLQQLEQKGVNRGNIYLFDLAARGNQGFRARLMELDSAALFNAAFTMPSGKFPRKPESIPQPRIIAANNELEKSLAEKHGNLSELMTDLGKITSNYSNIVALSDYKAITIKANATPLMLELLDSTAKLLSAKKDQLAASGYAALLAKIQQALTQDKVCFGMRDVAPRFTAKIIKEFSAVLQITNKYLKLYNETQFINLIANLYDSKLPVTSAVNNRISSESSALTEQDIFKKTCISYTIDNELQLKFNNAGLKTGKLGDSFKSMPRKQFMALNIIAQLGEAKNPEHVTALCQQLKILIVEERGQPLLLPKNLYRPSAGTTLSYAANHLYLPKELAAKLTQNMHHASVNLG